MNAIERLSSAFARRVLGPVRHGTLVAVDARTGVRRRSYPSYSAYVEHQSAKLRREFDVIAEHDKAYEDIVVERYGGDALAGRAVLCLGARLGGEVRAFRRLGALSVGVDLEPGRDNRFVLPGDVHDLQFADGVFDVCFTNIIDHVLDLETFVAETLRVLKRDGVLIAELARGPIKNYEVNDLSDGRAEAYLRRRLRQIGETPIVNKTNYTAWEGLRATYVRA
jgi:SAM-dependent methyltransferase